MKHLKLNLNVWFKVLGGRNKMVQLLVQDVGFSKKIIRFIDIKEI